MEFLMISLLKDKDTFLHLLVLMSLKALKILYLKWLLLSLITKIKLFLICLIVGNRKTLKTILNAILKGKETKLNLLPWTYISHIMVL